MTLAPALQMMVISALRNCGPVLPYLRFSRFLKGSFARFGENQMHGSAHPFLDRTFASCPWSVSLAHQPLTPFNPGEVHLNLPSKITARAHRVCLRSLTARFAIDLESCLSYVWPDQPLESARIRCLIPFSMCAASVSSRQRQEEPDAGHEVLPLRMDPALGSRVALGVGEVAVVGCSDAKPGGNPAMQQSEVLRSGRVGGSGSAIQ